MIRFRIDSNGVNFVAGLTTNEISSGSMRSHAFTSLEKVLLRFIATGKMQLCNGDDMGVS